MEIIDDKSCIKEIERIKKYLEDCIKYINLKDYSSALGMAYMTADMPFIQRYLKDEADKQFK